MTKLFLVNRVAGGLLALAGLLAAPRPAPAQAWQQALSSLTAPGTGGTCLASAVATDADGNAFVVGYFAGTVQFGATALMSTNQYPDLFVAKWAAATQQWAWATSGGGGYFDVATGVAVRGHEVLVAGNFTSNTNTPVTAVIAGTSLPGAGDIDLFVASYQDQGSTFSANWVVSGGGSGSDTAGGGLALAGNNLYVAGTYDRSGHAQIAGASLGVSPSNDYRAYLAKYPLAPAGPPGAGWVTDLGTGLPVQQPGRVAASGPNVYVAGHYQTYGGAFTVAGTAFPAPAAGNGTFVAKCTDAGASAQLGWGLLQPGNVNGLAARGATLYLTGSFTGSASLAGSALVAAGGADVFVARYLDQGSSASGAGALRDGGPGNDYAGGLALGTGRVLVSGSFAGGAATVAGTSLTAAPGGSAVFVASYTDNGTTLGPGWALATEASASGATGGPVALSGQRVLVAGSTGGSPITIGSQTLAPASATTQLDFLALAADSPLPVTLTSFTAVAAGPAAVRLTWATASETSSARFEVERSADGRTFAAVGSVAAAGSSATPRTYAYLDNPPPAPGPLYYRLRLLDQDGTARYSPVRPVMRGPAAEAGGQLFPNPSPAAGPAWLAAAPPAALVEVIDALGRCVARRTTDAAGTAALPPGLAPGVYAVRCAGHAWRWVVE